MTGANRITRNSWLGQMKWCFLLCAFYFIYYNRLIVDHHQRIERNTSTDLRIINPTTTVRRINRGRCCVSRGRFKDICGRPNCISCWGNPAAASDLILKRPEGTGRNRAFFIETSGSQSLNIRQACAVESLAFHNPNLTVFVLFMLDYGRNQSRNNQSIKPLLQKLKENYKNVEFLTINLDDYIAKTPLEFWFHCTDWRLGEYRVSHLSDGLRFLTLFKYGGYYFDLDVILVRPVSTYVNFVAKESLLDVASSAIHADYGHPLMKLAVNDFPLNYKRNAWTHNGPDLLLRVLTKYCGTNRLRKMNSTSCRGFNVHPESTFSPIAYSNWKSFFTHQRKANETDPPKWITKQVVGVHIWNKLSSKEVAYKNSTQEYVRLARDNCPEIFSIAPETF